VKSGRCDIVVCGAGGFIGGHLVAELRRRGIGRIRGVDLKDPNVWYQRFDDVENVSFDLQDRVACEQALAGAPIVYNLAADMGGMGFIEETGAAQHCRDARITPIYEGTNGIQSIDLVTRKLAANGGAAVWTLLGELTEIVIRVETSNDPAFGTAGAKLRDALGSLDRTSRWLLERVTSAPNEALAGATPYLRLFGSTLGGCMLAGEALAARELGEGAGDPQRYVTLARFFAENITVQAAALERTVMDSAEAVNGADAVLLA